MTRMVTAIAGLVFSVGALAQHSPTITALTKAVGEGNEKAVAEFWRECEAKGTPLVESITDEENHVWLTFLWRGDEDTNSVELVGGMAALPITGRLLHHIEGTDVWYITYRHRDDLRAAYRFIVNGPILPSVPGTDPPKRPPMQTDPFNGEKYAGGSLVELKNAPSQHWAQRDRPVPEGEVEIVKSFESAILGDGRSLTVYHPSGFDPAGDRYPLLVVFDRSAYTTLVPTRVILDNLIAARRIPPCVAVLVDNPAARRGVELPCNPDYARFLATELVPWMRENHRATEDPALTVVGGSSYGGLAASWAAFMYPEVFGNVLSQSGSYWWSKDWSYSNPDPEIEGEWLTRQYAAAGHKPIRFYLEVGLHEGVAPSMRGVNRHFRDVLQAHGYDIVDYNEYNGGHDYLNWRGSLADGLVALFGPPGH